MPIYEYRCVSCGEITEILVTSNTPDESFVCSHCGGTDLIKVLSTGSYTISGTTSISHGPRCGKDHTCCGAKTPCSSPPCKT